VTTQSDRERRDALLDDLLEASNEYFQREEARINDEVSFLKSVLRGRTGSERLAQANAEQAEILVIDDIGSFLAGTDT
jgi:hypothetical protein